MQVSLVNLLFSPLPLILINCSEGGRIKEGGLTGCIWVLVEGVVACSGNSGKILFPKERAGIKTRKCGKNLRKISKGMPCFCSFCFYRNSRKAYLPNQSPLLQLLRRKCKGYLGKVV